MTPRTRPIRKKLTQQPPRQAELTGTRDERSGQVVLLPNGDLPHRERFMQSFYTDCAPVGPIESQLVQVMAECSWRLNRAHAWEDHILALQFQAEAEKFDPANPPQVVDVLAVASAMEDKLDELDKLSAYGSRIQGQFSSCLKELRMLQSSRRERDQPDLKMAAR